MVEWALFNCAQLIYYYMGLIIDFINLPFEPALIKL